MTILLKKNLNLSELDSKRIDVFGQAWKAAMLGNKVCLVSPRRVDWTEVLGKFSTSMMCYVNSGLIYMRVLNDETGEDTVLASDLDNLVLEIGEAI